MSGGDISNRHKTTEPMNVRTLCLGVLSFGEATGYEIKKEIEEGPFSHFIEASFGSIYPALTQLLGEGLHPFNGQEKCWTRGEWKVFLFKDSDIDRAIRYVEQNPIKDGKLEDARIELSNLLRNMSVPALKESDSLRTSTKQNLDSILSAFGR